VRCGCLPAALPHGYWVGERYSVASGGLCDLHAARYIQLPHTTVLLLALLQADSAVLKKVRFNTFSAVLRLSGARCATICCTCRFFTPAISTTPLHYTTFFSLSRFLLFLLVELHLSSCRRQTVCQHFRLSRDTFWAVTCVVCDGRLFARGEHGELKDDGDSSLRYVLYSGYASTGNGTWRGCIVYALRSGT